MFQSNLTSLSVTSSAVPAETAEVAGAGPYAVVLGRAGAVELSVRGQAMDLSAYGSNQVARFEVK